MFVLDWVAWAGAVASPRLETAKVAAMTVAVMLLLFVSHRGAQRGGRCQILRARARRSWWLGNGQT